MKNTLLLKKISVILLVLLFAAAAVFAVSLLLDNPSAASAQEVVRAEQGETGAAETEPSAGEETQKGTIAIAASIAIGLAALGGAIGMGFAIAKSNESIARQPEMKNDIRSGMMLGLVFIETVVIYALIVAILVVFVL